MLQADRERLAARSEPARRRRIAWPAIAAQRRALGVTARDDAALLAARRRLAGRSGAARGAERGRRGRLARHPRQGRARCWTGSAATPPTRAEHWSDWRGEFLTGNGEPRADGAFVNKALADRRTPN